MEQWANQSHTKFSKNKRKVLHLERKKLSPMYRVETDWLGISFAKKDREVFIDSKLNLNYQCDLASKKTDIPLVSMVKGIETEDKVKQEMFLLEIRRSFFLITAVKQWKRLPGQAVQSPPLEVSKVRLNKALSYLVRTHS